MLIGLVVVIIGAILWHLGGQGHKWARAVAFPALIAIAKAVLLWNVFVVFYWLALWLMLAGFSYGESAPPRLFWCWLLKQDIDSWIVNVCTRATCGFFWCLAGLVFAFFTGHWSNFLIYQAIGTILVVVFGMIQEVNISELGTGASVASSIFI